MQGKRERACAAHGRLGPFKGRLRRWPSQRHVPRRSDAYAFRLSQQ